MPVIENATLPRMPWPDGRLPGTVPLGDAPWLLTTEVHDAQMALRDRLLATRRRHVLAALPGSAAALDELYQLVLAQLAQATGYRRLPGRMLRPDGAAVGLDRADPLACLGRLVQEDLCLLERRGGAGYVLTAAVLCFPSNWTLAEKLGHGMERIHVPVPAYDPGIARRVARLLDGVQPGRPLLRMNRNPTDRGSLFAPLREADPHPHPAEATARWLRMERQVLLRLPVSRAVVFSIHTFLGRSAAGAAA